MKTFVRLLCLVTVLSVAFISCKEDETPLVVNSFYVLKTDDVLFEEQINMGCSASGDGLTYAWDCSDGVFIGEGKEVSWLAPKKAGVYTIILTVKGSGETLTKTRDINVVGSYFFNFKSGPQISEWAYNKSVTSRTYSREQMSFFAKSPNAMGFYVKEFDGEFLPPYSFKTKLEINNDSVVPGGDPQMQLAIYLKDLNIQDAYLKGFVLKVLPTSKTWELLALLKKGTATQAQLLSSDSFSENQAIFTENNQSHVFSLSVLSDKKFCFYLDGQEIYSTMDLSTVALYNRNLDVSTFCYVLEYGLKMTLNGFYISNDGAALK